MEGIDRRRMLASLSVVGTGMAAGALLGAQEEEDVAPAEDLMREHGVLNDLGQLIPK